MRTPSRFLVPVYLLTSSFVIAQGTIPTFKYTFANNTYTLAGRDPAQAGTTTIPAVLVPVSLTFAAGGSANHATRLDARLDVNALLQSPVFSSFSFPGGGKTQYGDAMLRATFPEAANWHTLLGEPRVLPAIEIPIPAGSGYLLTSKRNGGILAVVDVEYVQKQLFKQLPNQPGQLVLAVTHNATYYAEGDATICCSWGTHGVDSATANSFVLASYLDAAPAIVADRDVQPITEQLAEFLYDPLHDPLIRQGNNQPHGNYFPAWLRPASMRPGDEGPCGGTSVASAYFLLEPTDTNHKNNLPASKAFIATTAGRSYHVQNIALLSWYLAAARKPAGAVSFPDATALTQPSKPCPSRAQRIASLGKPTAKPISLRAQNNSDHQLIGYWVGYGPAESIFPLREVSPQWDVIIVAFATPTRNADDGTLRFQTPAGYTEQSFKEDIALLKNHGKKVLISLGGGGEYFALSDPRHIPNFVSVVSRIISQYGFDGVDIDFESPSLSLDPGDTDFRSPTTQSIVNLIAGLRQLRQRFGPGFMISLVPEGTQIPAGYPSYGGQFGSYLPLAYGLRDILSFMDVQDYNTPPLQGLDGEIYQAGSVDYHAAMTELVLHGFNAGREPGHFFPPLAPSKVAVGFLTDYDLPDVVSQAMSYIMSGKEPPETRYKLLKRYGYPDMIGAMFWNIDSDREENYRYSNLIGPQLHGHPASQ